MKPDEIKKALECCNSTERGKCFNECPYHGHYANCINDQQAEIERLKYNLKAVLQEIEDED